MWVGSWLDFLVGGRVALKWAMPPRHVIMYLCISRHVLKSNEGCIKNATDTSSPPKCTMNHRSKGWGGNIRLRLFDSRCAAFALRLICIRPIWSWFGDMWKLSVFHGFCGRTFPVLAIEDYDCDRYLETWMQALDLVYTLLDISGRNEHEIRHSRHCTCV
jgi:hypothetical protein